MTLAVTALIHCDSTDVDGKETKFTKDAYSFLMLNGPLKRFRCFLFGLTIFLIQLILLVILRGASDEGCSRYHNIHIYSNWRCHDEWFSNSKQSEQMMRIINFHFFLSSFLRLIQDDLAFANAIDGNFGREIQDKINAISDRDFLLVLSKGRNNSFWPKEDCDHSHITSNGSTSYLLSC